MPQSGFEDGFTVATSGSLDEWVKEIHAKVPGAIEGYIYDQVKLVLKDFFQRTKSWRTNIGPLTAQANDGELCLNPVDSWSDVIEVLQIARNGSVLVPIGHKAERVVLRNETNTRNPSRYYLEPYHTVHLVPTPVSDVEDIYVTAALTPRLRSDNRIDQWIIDQHYEVIKAGTLQRLYEEPGKVYTNTNSAEYWGKKYRSELARSTTAAHQNYSERPQPWGFNRFNM